MDQSQSLSQALHGRAAEPNNYTDLQEWLAPPTTAPPSSQPAADSATSAGIVVYVHITLALHMHIIITSSLHHHYHWALQSLTSFYSSARSRQRACLPPGTEHRCSVKMTSLKNCLHSNPVQYYTVITSIANMYSIYIGLQCTCCISVCGHCVFWTVHAACCRVAIAARPAGSDCGTCTLRAVW